MKYSVDIDEIINELFRKNIGLVSSFENGHHHPMDFLWCHPIFNRYHHSLPFDEWYTSSYYAECRSLINNPIWFQSPLFQLLFKSFVAAEGKFIMNYIPQNSHEERLTGHLVSELENGLFILREYFEGTANKLYGQNVPLGFYYCDLSANNQEKYTGADLGLIFYVNLPDFPKHIRIAAIQSKKIKNSSALIDVPQLEAIIDRYNEDAYYLFYDREVSPLIKSATEIKKKQRNDNTHESFSYNRKDAVYEGMPLSVFLVFDMLTSFMNTEGKRINSLWEAKKRLMNFERKDKPSKILTISIGEIRHEDLHNISDLFKNDFPID